MNNNAGVEVTAEPIYLDLTLERLLRVWWEVAWRGVLFGVLAGAVIGGIEGALFHLELLKISLILVNIPIGIYVVRAALKARYKEFTIRLVAKSIPRQN